MNLVTNILGAGNSASTRASQGASNEVRLLDNARRSYSQAKQQLTIANNTIRDMKMRIADYEETVRMMRNKIAEATDKILDLERKVKSLSPSEGTVKQTAEYQNRGQRKKSDVRTADTGTAVSTASGIKIAVN